MKPLRFIALLMALSASATAQAATILGDRERAIEVLKSLPPCCVVDARSDGPRLLRPLKDAVVWGKDVHIAPTGTVVVIADSDKAALAVAARIRQRFKARHVLAIKGSLDTWREVLAAAQEPGMPATFVIPMNTCEQGKPLQILRSNRR